MVEHSAVNRTVTGSSPVAGASMEEIYKKLVYVGDDLDYEKIAHREGWSALRCAKYGPGGHKEILGYTSPGAPKGPNYLWATKGKNLMALNLLDLTDPAMVPFSAIKHGDR